MFQTKVVKKIKTQISCSVIFFFFSKIVLFMTLCEKKKIVKMTKTRMRIRYRIPKPTNTYSQYVIIIAFPLHQQLGVSVLRCTCNACLVLLRTGQTAPQSLRFLPSRIQGGRHVGANVIRAISFICTSITAIWFLFISNGVTQREVQRTDGIFDRVFYFVWKQQQNTLHTAFFKAQ